MEKAKKWLFKIILVLILVFTYQYINVNYFTKEQVVSNKINVSQAVVLNDQKSSFLSYQVKEGETALDLLKNNYEVITKGEGVNAYVTKINKREALSSKKEYWAFYINNKPSEVGAGSYILKSGDKIEWKIQTY